MLLIILSNVGLITSADNLSIFGVIPSSPVAFDGSSDLKLVIKISSVIRGIYNCTISGTLLSTCDLK